MNNLKDLKDMVAEMFSKAEQKEDIEKLATINNKIKDIEEEHDTLVEQNGQILASYKDLVAHTSFADDKKPGDTVTGVSSITFEDALEQFISNQK